MGKAKRPFVQHLSKHVGVKVVAPHMYIYILYYQIACFGGTGSLRRKVFSLGVGTFRTGMKGVLRKELGNGSDSDGTTTGQGV